MSVKSAVRVLHIFQELSHYPDGRTVKEISESLNIPQSSTFQLINTLLNEGYVTLLPGTKRYKLGVKLIQLGTVAMDQFNLSQLSEPFLRVLMEAVQETVFMATLAKDELVYISKINNNRSIQTTARPGYPKPLYCTGLGKAFLTFLPETQRRELIENLTLAPVTANTITEKDELEVQLAASKERGYAIDDEENEEGLYCLAAPIYGPTGTMQAAISVAGPKERMLKQRPFIIEELTKKASFISNLLN
ncbi:IclR family transcriptional regulator [Shouchella shacheensis]|uniref:IclR family transcriptional regulator n=1 Tax=Shouchella shacheensis TaxID=1649580 RepID=UPI00073FC8A9|nr:IclR family transcriptional regulator [Shouchella shacheensis]